VKDAANEIASTCPKLHPPFRWGPGGNSSGVATINGRALFFEGETIQSTMPFYVWSQGVPGSMGAGILSTANMNANLTGTTVNRSMTVVFRNGSATQIIVSPSP
jgi:hypothetical protein